MKPLLLNVALAAAVLVGCSPNGPPPPPPAPPATPEAAKADDPLGAKPVAPEPHPVQPRPDPAPLPLRPPKGQPLRPAAPPLPAPPGEVVVADSVAKLQDAVAGARDGTTI